MLVENQIILKQLEGDPKNPGQPLLEAYNDGFGTWTIGWGHTSKVKQGDKITLTQAESYFQADVKEWETVVKINNFNKFTDKNKLDALTMFAFNKGYGVLKLMFRIKEDPSYSNVSRVWRSYDIIKGKHSVGLLNRRNKELEVFFKNDALEIQESQKIVKKQEEQQVQIEEIKKKTVRFIRYTVLVDTTVDEFINNNQSLVPNISKEDLLKFNPEGNRSNADLIYSKYTQEEQYNNKENLSTFNLDPIKVNTTILIPLSELQEQLYITGGKNLFIDQNKGLSAYFIEEQIKLQQDSRYVKMDKLYQFGEVDVQTIDTLAGGECLSLDTKIKLLDGRDITLQQMIDEYNSGKINWVYSCHPTTGNIVPGKVTWAGITRKNTNVMKLTFDNNESVIVTPDHKFPIKDVGFVEAKDLQLGQSMIPLYTKKQKLYTRGKTYEMLFQNDTAKWIPTHRMVAEYFRMVAEKFNKGDLYNTFTYDPTVDIETLFNNAENKVKYSTSY
jgi:GH24 family phage-related lysozyme (muramidase)